MHQPITKLLSIASEPIGNPVGKTEVLNRWGTLGKDLAETLKLRNGFYAYESALLVRPLHKECSPLGLLEWNAPHLWKAKYKEGLDDMFFFAEDVFGGQYCICGESICTFDPETGQVEVMGSSLSAWANDVMSDYEFRTGYPFAHTWQSQNRPLPAGMRLIPKIPFVCGGKYEVKNLYCLEDVQGMRFRASIANQIRDLPDGAEIVFKLEHDAPTET